TSPHEPVVPSKRFKGKSGIAPIADFVMETDWSAGQVIKAVDDAGIADNTIVIFTADNGHSHYTGWPDLIKAGHLPSGEFRGHKGDVWEGGHRVPFVVRWPGKIKANSQSKQLIGLNDVFATCAELIGKNLPTNGAEDSVSFLNDLRGKRPANPRHSLVNHSNHGEFSYREHDWKLVYPNQTFINRSRGKKRIPELYHLAYDIAETNNVAKHHPDHLSSMSKNLSSLINRGSTRSGLNSKNDGVIDHTTTQRKRWADQR
ncbi:MAG: sulfatase-like hydrolase/transferase, partial [Limisphaerales bacterium]